MGARLSDLDPRTRRLVEVLGWLWVGLCGGLGLSLMWVPP